MTTERTLSIIKPDAVAKNAIGKVISRFEETKLKVVAAKMMTMTQQQAGDFYAVHKDRPFFGELCDYMVSGPVVVMVLEGENAIAANRAIMGATDPKKAAPGTLRFEVAESINANAVHGSDSAENAAVEIKLFFPEL